jgi:hypothetical protein
MAKKSIFTCSEILDKIFELFEKEGLDAITARNIAKKS